MNTANHAQRKPTIVFGDAAAYDNFLTDELYRDVWIWMNRAEFARAGSQRWISIWGFDDAEVLRGQQWGGDYPNWKLELMPNPDPGQSPPAPEALVKFFAAFRSLLHDHEGLPEIKRIVMAPHVYPPQTGLTWHCDGPDARGTRVGAFTYYLHREWNAEWGGELLLTDIRDHAPGLWCLDSAEAESHPH